MRVHTHAHESTTTNVKAHQKRKSSRTPHYITTHAHTSLLFRIIISPFTSHHYTLSFFFSHTCQRGSLSPFFSSSSSIRKLTQTEKPRSPASFPTRSHSHSSAHKKTISKCLEAGSWCFVTLHLYLPRALCRYLIVTPHHH